MAGASFSIAFRKEDLQAITDAVEASTSEYLRAADRAAKRTMIWLRQRISQEVGAALGIPQSSLRTRITMKKTEGRSPAWVLFMGVNRLPYDKTGPTSQNPYGLLHRSGAVKGGFKADVSGQKGWIRKGRAKALGLKLPGGEGVRSETANLPIIRISHDLDASATPIIERYGAQVNRLFMQRFEHELKQIKGLN